MNWKSRIMLALGLTGVIALAATLVVYVDSASSAIASTKAEITAKSLSVGTDYTGLVTQQYVQEGDDVTAGQTLFRIKSATLLEQLQAGEVRRSDLIYPLSPEGEILLVAPKAGTVSKVYFGEGSFIPANKEAALIVDRESVGVKATYSLSRKDFAKLGRHSRVEVRLPDGTYVNGMAESITVVDQAATVETEIVARLDRFSNTRTDLSAGTPVISTVHLKEDTYWSRIKTYFGKLL